MFLADAVEQWARINRPRLDDEDKDRLRRIWSTLRFADAGTLDVHEMSEADGRAAMALFDRNDGPDIANTLNGIVRWARSQPRVSPELPPSPEEAPTFDAAPAADADADSETHADAAERADGDADDEVETHADAAERADGDADDEVEGDGDADAGDDDGAAAWDRGAGGDDADGVDVRDAGDGPEAEAPDWEAARPYGDDGDVDDVHNAAVGPGDDDDRDDDDTDASGRTDDGPDADADGDDDEDTETDVPDDGAGPDGADADAEVAAGAEPRSAPPTLTGSVQRPVPVAARIPEPGPLGQLELRRPEPPARPSPSTVDDGGGGIGLPGLSGGSGDRSFTHLRGSTRWIVAVLAVAAAVGAALSGAEPTGTPGWDHALLAVLAATFVMAATVAPTWLLIIVAVIGVAFVRDSIWIAPASLGVVVAVSMVLFPRRRWLPAAVGALALQGLLRLSDIGFFGLPSLLAGVAIASILWFGVRALDPTRRRRVHLAGACVAALAVVVSVVGGLVLLSARTDVEAGIEAARSGVAAARDGEPEAVVAELEDASEALARGRSRVDSIFATPLRLVPVASQHLDVVRTAVRYGSDIADQASRSVIEADVSEIRMRAGSVDLSALSGMRPDLVATADLVEAAADDLTERRTDWLIGPIGTRVDDLTDELVALVPEARLAADAALVVPGLLGEDGPRRYFVAFGSPAESRELGGFVGSWALVEFDRGAVRLVDSARIADLYDLTRQKPFLDLQDFPLSYSLRSQPNWWPQNITGSPELGTVAEASRVLFEGLGGGSIDGFVYVDSVALAALIEITGPIEIDGIDDPITLASSSDFFLDGQYRLTERDELKAELGDVFAEVFERLVDTTLPGPEQLGRILGPAARQGHLQVATFDDDENAFFQSIKVQRPFGWPTGAADGFAIVQTNGSVSKLDLYLHRDVTYDVLVDDDGQLTGTVSVELSSRIPDDAPPLVLGKDDPGRNVVQLSLFTPHLIDGARLDGDDVDPAITNEFGYRRAEVGVELPPDAVRTVVFDVRGRIDPDRPYTVSVWHQPLVNPDSVEIRQQVGDGTPVSTRLELIETTVVSLAP